MYLTGGQYKGTKIEIPKTAKPTLSKVRESIFNILISYQFEKYTFLDMFAGSGIMGLEATSRGYKVKELEINPKSAKLIKENYRKIHVEPSITVVNSIKYKSDEKYEIIYVDPPWDSDYSEIIKKAQTLLDKNGIIIIEHDNIKKINVNEIIKENDLALEVVKSKKYGRALIDILSFVN